MEMVKYFEGNIQAN